MKNKIQKHEALFSGIVIFLICFIPRLLVNIQVPFISIISDEVSTLSAATIWSGLDWSSVVSNAGYYGGGFTVLFTPLFMVVDDTILLYHIIINIYAAVQALIGVIAYIIIKRHTELESNKIAILLSVVASFLVTRRATNITNETPLILVCWVTVFLLLELYEAQKIKKVYGTVFLALFLGYATTLHTRGIVLLASFCVVFFLVLLFYRKSLVNPIVFLGTMGGAYIAGQYFIDYLQAYFFASATTTSAIVRNTEVSTTGISLLFDVNYWNAWVALVLGPVGTITVLTGGTIIIAAVVYYVLAKECILKTLNDVDQKKLVVMTYTLAAIVATILAFSVSWLGSVATAMDSGTGQFAYALKGLTYIRYFGPYIGPFIIMGLIYFGVHRVKKNIVIIGTLCLIIGYFTCCIIPYIYANSSGNEVFVAFARSTIIDTMKYYLYGIIALLVIGGLLLALSYYKKYTIALCILCLYLGYQYVYDGIYIDAQTSEVYTSERINTYEQLEEVIESLPEYVYVEDGERGEDNDHQIYYTYQLLLKDNVVIPGMPEGEDESVFISNTADAYEEAFTDGYYLVVLDGECDYVYVKGDEIEQLFIDSGYELVDYDYMEYSSNFTQSEDELIYETTSIALSQGTYEVDFTNIILEDISNIQMEIEINDMVYSVESELFESDTLKMTLVEEESSVVFRIIKDIEEVGEVENIKEVEDAEDIVEFGDVFYTQTSRNYILDDEFDYGEIESYLSNVDGKIYYYEEVGYVEIQDEGLDIEFISIEDTIVLEDSDIILCVKGNLELINLLSVYDIVEEFNNYYVLQNAKTNTDELTLLADIEDIYKGVSVGTYEVVFDSEECTSYKIISDNYVSAQYKLEDNATSLIFTAWSDLKNLEIQFYDIFGNEIDVDIIDIQAISSQCDVYSGFWDIVAENDIKEDNTICVLDTLIQEEHNVRSLENYFIQYNNYFSNGEIGLESQYEYLLLDNSQNIYDYLEEYTPIDSNERYVLLQNNDTVESRVFDITIFENTDGTYTIPEGMYTLYVRVNLDDVYQDTISVVINTSDELYSTIDLTPTEEDYENGYIDVIQSLNQMYELPNISIELDGIDNEQIESISIEQNESIFNMELPYSDGESQLIIESGESLAIGDSTITAGSYQYVIYYEGEDADFTATVNKDYNSMLDYNTSSNSVEIDGEQALIIEIYPSATRYNVNVTIENTGDSDVEISRIEVINLS